MEQSKSTDAAGQTVYTVKGPRGFVDYTQAGLPGAVRSYPHLRVAPAGQEPDSLTKYSADQAAIALADGEDFLWAVLVDWYKQLDDFRDEPTGGDR